jgi:hypothetical protein
VRFSSRFLPWRFRASRTGLKTGHYKELPGCAADAKTYKEALADWKSLFRNGLKPPTAKGCATQFEACRPPHPRPRSRPKLAVGLLPREIQQDNIGALL